MKEQMREIDRRMMNLPVGQADAEYEVLDAEYDRLRKLLYLKDMGAEYGN